MPKRLVKRVTKVIVNTSKGKHTLRNENISNCPIVLITIPFLIPNAYILDVRKHTMILTGIATAFYIVLLVFREKPAFTS